MHPDLSPQLHSGPCNDLIKQLTQCRADVSTILYSRKDTNSYCCLYVYAHLLCPHCTQYDTELYAKRHLCEDDRLYEQ